MRATLKPVIIIIFLALFRIPSSALQTNSSSSGLSSEIISWLLIPPGGEPLAALMVGVTADYLLIEYPDQREFNPTFKERDWPPRLIFTVDRDPDSTPEIDEEIYIPVKSELINRMTLESGADRYELTLFLHHPLPFTLQQEEGYLRLYVQYSGEKWQKLKEGPGWRLWNLQRFQQDGIQTAHIIQLDPKHPAMRIQVGHAGGFGRSRATPEEFAIFNNALGAVNGGYFTAGSALGLYLVDEEIVSLPILSRPAIFFDALSTPMVLSTNATCLLTIPSLGSLEIKHVNDFSYGDPVILTEGHPARVRGEFKGRKIVIRKKEIIEITEGEITNLSSATVIWDPESSDRFLNKIRVGDEVNLLYKFAALPYEPTSALQAGPELIRASTIVVDEESGSFPSNITSGRAPRTAAAINKYGELLLFVGEGRQKLHSLGFTLKEVAQILHDAGASAAINLDGGASSSLFIDGRYYGETPSGRVKSVPNVILFGDLRAGGDGNYQF